MWQPSVQATKIVVDKINLDLLFMNDQAERTVCENEASEQQQQQQDRTSVLGSTGRVEEKQQQWEQKSTQSGGILNSRFRIWLWHYLCQRQSVLAYTGHTARPSRSFASINSHNKV